MTEQGAASEQEAEVTVEAWVTRLIPCAEHTDRGDGEQHYDGAGRPMQNPNGYRHDCGACAATPRLVEKIEAEGAVIHLER